MAIIKCPECGHDVSDRAKTCPHCGIAIAGQITICPDCGEVIFKDAAECGNCHCPINGASLVAEKPVTPASKKKNIVSGLEEPDKDRPAKRKVKRSYTAMVVSLVIALIVVLLGLYFYQITEQHNELRAYENAVSSGEPAVLQNFLDVYADAPRAHLDSVRFHLGELKKIDLEWEQAVGSGSKTELLRYIGRHPGNIHVTEAHILVDSIDWGVAVSDNTADGYQLYLDEHPNGGHVDEAHEMFEKLDALRLKPEERDMIRRLFVSFFEALAQKDESALVATMTAEMSSFMSKENATTADAVSYMHTLFQPSDISSLSFTVMDDMKIVKQPTETEGRFMFAVSVSVEKRIERSDQEQERFASYKVLARVNSSAKITALNMQKIGL